MKYFIFIALLFNCSVNANTIDTNLLLTLNYDQMNKRVRAHIDKATAIAIKSQDEGKENEGDVLYQLKKAAVLVLARPNRDFMSAELLPDIEKELNTYNAYQPTLISLIKEASRIIADKEAPVKVKSAYYYVIENILAEMLPQMKKKNKQAIEIFQHVAQAKIKIPKKLSDFRYLEKMESGEFAPSKYAQTQLDLVLKPKKKKYFWQFWK